VRIALVGPAHPYKGGGARHTTELAHRLAAAGHDVIIESWRAQYPSLLYPGQQTVDRPEGWPYPRTYRRLAWYRPDGWVAAGRRLRTADLVIFALLTPLQAPSYVSVLTALGPRRPRTMAICHNVLPHERRPGDVILTRNLLSRVDTVVVHSAEQAAQARDLAPDVPIVVARMPPHLPQGGYGGTGSPPVSGGGLGGVVPPEETQQAFGELDLALVQEQVGGVGYRGDLAGDRLDEGRMGVPEGADRDPGDQVQVLAPVRIPDPAALAASDRHRRHAVVRHQGGREPLLQCRCLASHGGFGLAHGRTSSGMTMVPMPASVKISSRTA
jgi:hypothetical protein